MPTTTRLPSYRRHRASGQAVVTIEGRDHYLGKYNSAASRNEYKRLLGEYLARGTLTTASGDVSIVELLKLYREHSRGYYVKNGQPTATLGRIRVATKPLRELYGRTLACNFGPLALKAVRQQWIDAGLSRRYVNNLTDEVRRIFKWAVAEELVAPSVYQALSAVPGLRKGRTEAREAAPILPVDNATVDATLPHLPAVVADMVRFQRLTGCRPNEVCILRPRDVDTSGEVWLYRPESHKTEHHGRERIIMVGPKGQAVLRPYLLRPADAYCFAPTDTVKHTRAERTANRKTPIHYGNRPGMIRKAKPKRTAGQHYSKDSYRRAVQRAADLADKKARKGRNDLEEGERLIECWSPNRLRHAAATEIRKRFGLEAAQVTLGHASADVTQVYAERDLQKAAAVMREVG